MTCKVEPIRQSDSIQRAMEYGLDISRLIENLKLMLTERVRKAQSALESLVALQTEVQSFRALKIQKL